MPLSKYAVVIEGLLGAESFLTFSIPQCRCSEERLFSLGWKDSFGYYGNQDGWMLRPNTSEMKLLLMANIKRGGSAQLVDHLPFEEEGQNCNSNADEDFAMWSPLECRVPEEDCCLLPLIPDSIKSLPLLLNNFASSHTEPHLHHEILYGRSAKRSCAVFEMMSILFSHEAQARLNCSGFSGSNEARLLLDYVPMLRTMATYERAVLAIPDREDSRISRRTRKSARNGRIHYFESLNPNYEWGEENCFSATEVGDRLSFGFGGMDSIELA